MRSFPAKTLLGIALISAVVLSVSGQAASLDARGRTAGTAASDGAVLQPVNAESHTGTIELSARKKKSRRSRSDAAIAAGVLGFLGGIIAAEQHRRYDRHYWDRDDYYEYRHRRRPRYRHERRRPYNPCPGGKYTDEGGRVVCE
jgi:hypothetical protein